MSKHCDLCFQSVEDKPFVTLHAIKQNSTKIDINRKIDVCETCIVPVNGLIAKMNKNALEKLPKELKSFFQK